MMKKTILVTALVLSIARFALADGATQEKCPPREVPKADALTQIDVTTSEDGTLKMEERTIGVTREDPQPDPASSAFQGMQPPSPMGTPYRTSPSGTALALLGAGAVLALLNARSVRAGLAIFVVSAAVAGAAYLFVGTAQDAGTRSPEPLGRAVVRGS